MILALFAGGALSAQTPAQQYVEALKGREPLKNAVWGVLAKDADGHVLAEYNAGTRMVPASNMKLVTTGAALHALGADHRIETRLGYTGTIEDGTLHGDLYIIGGGDPTLGVKDSIALAPEAIFWKWKTLLKEAGIQRIDGRIIGDGRAFEGNLENSSWTYDDTGTYYGTGGNALSFYANAIDFRVAAATEGEPVQVRQVYPETPWMHFTNYGFTGPAGTGNSLYLFTTDLAPYSELRGSFATDRKPKVEHFANKFGALTCAYYFWKNLRDTGWPVSGGYADIDRNGYIRGKDFVPGDRAGTPEVIGSFFSPSLKAIVRETNCRSDNFYAETLLRLMGETATSIAVYDSCYVAEKEVIEDLGLEMDGLRIEDGSGLSRRNSVTPAFLVSFLEAMQKSPAFPAYLASLPQAGEGTLRGILTKHPAAARIRMKSGSMDGVLCYSGYILSEDGTPSVTFSILTNNTTAKVADVRTVIVRIIDFLAQ